MKLRDRARMSILLQSFDDGHVGEPCINFRELRGAQRSSGRPVPRLVMRVLISSLQSSLRDLKEMMAERGSTLIIQRSIAESFISCRGRQSA
ncbi:hypothetical protein MPLA_760026 [Mesorhizobium sp. ORS 3359]|nr:hypothetical protein MPLA_760026 [Mesorhizobium sp. ORS 3359]